MQRSDAPTRAVFVVRDAAGDREFAGFSGPTTSYSDCFLREEALPREDIQVSAAPGRATGWLVWVVLRLACLGARPSTIGTSVGCFNVVAPHLAEGILR